LFVRDAKRSEACQRGSASLRTVRLPMAGETGKPLAAAQPGQTSCPGHPTGRKDRDGTELDGKHANQEPPLPRPALVWRTHEWPRLPEDWARVEERDGTRTVGRDWLFDRGVARTTCLSGTRSGRRRVKAVRITKGGSDCQWPVKRGSLLLLRSPDKRVVRATRRGGKIGTGLKKKNDGERRV
jgi:hypothetical protein